MERFYLKQEYQSETIVQLKEDEHHHLFRVMRLREGETIELVNGMGSLAKGKIVKIEKGHTSLQILHVDHAPPQERQILSGIPLMRPSKLEWIVEKGTELGATSFLLYSADHSTQESLSEHQQDRLRHITISSLKQSQRLYLPHLEILPDLKTLLTKQVKIFFGDPRASLGFKAPDTLCVLFITGPESGFSKEEYELLQHQAEGVRLNQNVLRAETAPIVALSLLGV